MKSQSKTNLPEIAKALRGQETDFVPFWYMRQAGRYLPEYHEVRNKFTFMDLCRAVDSAVEVTVQPHRRYGMDGIVMFSDILTPLNGAGIELHFEEKKGPIIDTKLKTVADLDIINDFDPIRDTGYVSEILKKIRNYIDTLPEGQNRPGLLGFAGAPFTLASYVIEGGSSKQFTGTKSAIFGNSDFYHKLADRLADITIDYLSMQAESGVDTVQLFDSWGGILSPADYREFALPYTQKIIREFSAKHDIPVILFVGNAAHLLPEMVSQKPSAISLDWRVRAESALEIIPDDIAIQGNMDPLVLYGNPERVTKSVNDVLANFGRRKGYVFNLGHGIHPESKLENVQAMVDAVRAFKK